MRAATVAVVRRVGGIGRRRYRAARRDVETCRATVRPMLAPLARSTPGRILFLLSLAELMGMSPWFAASAVAPQFAARWGLSAAQSAGLTSSVQLGFVAGTATAALLNLADLFSARFYF